MPAAYEFRMMFNDAELLQTPYPGRSFQILDRSKVAQVGNGPGKGLQDERLPEEQATSCKGNVEWWGFGLHFVSNPCL